MPASPRRPLLPSLLLPSAALLLAPPALPRPVPPQDDGASRLTELERRVAELERERAAHPSDLVEVGGQYRIVADAANFGWHPSTVPADGESSSFVNQRFRTRLTVRPNERVRGHLEVEMGHIVWGDDFEFPKTFSGPRFPASTDPNGDRVGLEVRRAWLGVDAAGGSWRAGVQDRQDAFGQTLFSSDWDFNVGGVSYERESDEGTRLSAGAFALWEGDASAADDSWLVTLDVDRDLDAETSVGASAYYLSDGGQYSYPTVGAYDEAWDLWLGVRASRGDEDGVLRGALVWNGGERDGGAGDFEHAGWLARVESAGWDAPGGEVDVQALWSSGGDPGDLDSGSFRTVAQSERDGFGAQGYWSYLALSSPHGPSDVADLGVGPQNRGLGLLTIQARHRARLSERWGATTAVGWLRSDVENPVSGSSDLGFEVAETLALDLGGGLVLEFGGAYLVTGDFYAAAPDADVDDLWELFCRFQLEF